MALVIKELICYRCYLKEASRGTINSSIQLSTFSELSMVFYKWINGCDKLVKLGMNLKNKEMILRLSQNAYNIKALINTFVNTYFEDYFYKKRLFIQ